MVSVAVIAAGSGLTLREAHLARKCEVVVAADRGFKSAVATGCRVDVVVGDLDSLTGQGRDTADRLGTRVVAFAADKDESDLELALREARATPGVDQIHVFGVAGGRPDHAAINLAVLAAPEVATVPTVVHLGEVDMHVVRDTLEVAAEPGTIVSLLAHGGPAGGVTTSGLRWRLQDATLEPFVALGLSNEVTGSPVKVKIDTGALFVFVEVDAIPK